jgi:hypothetical protein
VEFGDGEVAGGAGEEVRELNPGVCAGVGHRDAQERRWADGDLGEDRLDLGYAMSGQGALFVVNDGDGTTAVAPVEGSFE